MSLINTIDELKGINTSIKEMIPKSFDELMDEVASDEEKLKRIDKLKPGTKIYCIKSHIQISKRFDNFRDYLDYHYNKQYLFQKDKIYEVGSIDNFYINLVDKNNPPKSQLTSYRMSLIGKYINDMDFFEYFMLESEWTALERDKKIDDILDNL